MEKLARYRTVVKELLAEHARYKPSHGDIEPVIVCDEARDRYLLLDIGWDGPRRVHEAILHLQLADGTIRIEHDGSPPPGAAVALIEAGVPREDIVLAFHPPHMREFAGSATA
jgi:hypothetical protein